MSRSADDFRHIVPSASASVDHDCRGVDVVVDNSVDRQLMRGTGQDLKRIGPFRTENEQPVTLVDQQIGNTETDRAVCTQVIKSINVTLVDLDINPLVVGLRGGTGNYFALLGAQLEVDITVGVGEQGLGGQASVALRDKGESALLDDVHVVCRGVVDHLANAYRDRELLGCRVAGRIVDLNHDVFGRALFRLGQPMDLPVNRVESHSLRALKQRVNDAGGSLVVCVYVVRVGTIFVRLADYLGGELRGLGLDREVQTG